MLSRQLKPSAQSVHGANLAKLRIELIFHKKGELSRMRSAWLNGIKTFPVAYA